jgi:hypothetical protein
MLYQQLNNHKFNNNKLNKIYDTIENLVIFAKENNLKYYVCGGTALAIFNKSIYRINEDLEFAIDYNQKDIWINFLEKNGFKYEKNASLWPLGNEREWHRSKDGFKLELILLENNSIQEDYFTVNLNNLNINVYEPLKVLEVKLKYIKKKKKIIREKDKKDFLKFQKYFIDNI